MIWQIGMWLALGALVLLGLRHWHFTSRQRALEAMLAELSAGRRPRAFAFFESPRFHRLGLLVESLADDQQAWRVQADAERSHLRAILASMAEGVLVCAPDGTIHLANTSLARLFALEEDPTGKSVTAALRAPAVDQLLAEAGAASGPRTAEMQVQRPGSPTTHLAASAVALAGTSGELEGMVVVFHDITRLRELEDVRRELVANVSHELRTPLAVIQGYLENLLEEPAMPRTEVAAALRVMQRHSHRLNALASDMLTLSRLEAGRETLHCEPLAPAELADELLASWQLQLAAKQISAHSEIDPRLPAIHADRLRLGQALDNLVDNALRHTPAGGSIHLRAYLDAGLVHLELSDTGEGIGPADLPHIFERFYRVDKGRSREGGGTGLGLSIVKHIVAAHGGHVSARSQPGQGTTIVLALPVSG